ncbi:type VI secretion protein VasK, partial [Enterobacter hormaechei]
MKKVSKPLGAGLLIVAVLLMILFIFAQTAQLPSGSGDDNFWYVLAGFIILTTTLCTPVFFTLSRQQNPSPVTPDGENNHNEERSSDQYNFSALSRHLRRRYSSFWRSKVRLLLITGDEAAIEQLVPGLQQQQWLEGNRTVLIYGGSLASEPDREKYTALRKLRRGRPLDGIIRLLPESLKLTPHISDSDLRGLEKISELLRYSAPVWLWQLCSSHWSQGTRPEQAVGASFPPRAKEDDVIRQLERMLPALRAQGMSQVAENNRHDFLLRLGQHLKDGAVTRWAQQLVPWLSVSQQRVPLRGLMFSLPEKKAASMSEKTVDAEKYVPESQRHALTLPATWQGIVDDCTRVRGRRVGMAWEQTLAWTLMAIIGVWGAGTLLSFAVNRMQIVSVAEQAHALVEHPSVSDYQLTALHELRNDAGRLLHHIQDGAPWYQRFGLDHDQQLLDAMLPWYGVANNRLIRDPANEALKQKLIALVNSAPNSDQRTQMAKPG